MAETVYLDAGHGGYDRGAAYEGRLEKDDNLRLTMAVGKILQDQGVDVKYTRTTDVYNSPYEKAAIANNGDADLVVSIHRNAAVTPNLYNGVQSLVFDDSGFKAQVARNINNQLEDVGYNNINVEERPNLTILRRTKAPAVLVEVGFIDSDKDNELFDEKFQQTANAIAQGILESLSVKGQSVTQMYSVQVGMYEDYNQAISQANDLKNRGYDVKIALL